MIEFDHYLDQRISSYEEEIKRNLNVQSIPKKSQQQLDEIRKYYKTFYVQGEVTLKEFKKFAPKHANRVLDVLDFGCGAGGLVTAFSAAGNNVIGVDPDSVSIEMGLNASTKIGKTLDLRLLTGDELPFENDTFDVVLSKSVLEHVENKEKYINEAMRVLRQGGIFYIAYNCNKYFYLEHHSLLPIYKCFGGREQAILSEFGFQPYWKITPQSYGQFKNSLESTGYHYRIIPGRMIISSSLIGRVANKLLCHALSIFGLHKYLCSGWVAVVTKD